MTDCVNVKNVNDFDVISNISALMINVEKFFFFKINIAEEKFN